MKWIISAVGGGLIGVLCSIGGLHVVNPEGGINWLSTIIIFLFATLWSTTVFLAAGMLKNK